MDGITMNAPYSERPRVNMQISLLDILEGTENENKEPIPYKIYDWRSNTSLEFRSMLNGGIE